MTAKNERPPGGAHTGTNAKAGFQRRHSIMSRLELQELILSFLRSGAENAVTLRDIRNQTGLDGRAVRLAIREMRLRGVPVVSDCCHGYWLSDVPAEIRRCAYSLRHRARETAKAADALSAVADELEKAVAT